MSGQRAVLASGWLGPAPGGLARRLARVVAAGLARLRSADQPTAPGGRQVAADVALAAAAAAASLAVIVLTMKSPPGTVSPAYASSMRGLGGAASLPAVALRAAPLTIRRLRPLTALWLVLAACVLVRLPATSMVNLIALVLAAYAALVYSRYRSAAVLSLPAAWLILALPGVAPPDGNYALVIMFLALGGVLAAGNAVRTLRSRAHDSRLRLLRLQAEHQDATRQAIGQERARIASELHDVVTHNVSMMVVQAGAARRVLTASPEEARSALLAVEESGRAAIIELQHLLGLLAPPGEPEDPGPAGIPETGPLPPQPGLDRVPPLIARVAAAGVPVELSVRGTPCPLPAGLDLAAYRVVQEALTNVIKHAGQPRTTVTLDYRRSALAIEVADDGRPGATAATAGPGPAPGPARDGRGLIGLRERVSMYGGTLEAGSRPGGGWLLRAAIPGQPPSAPPGPAAS